MSILSIVKRKIAIKLPNGKTAKEVISERVRQRLRQKIKKMFPDSPKQSFKFDEIFDLPWWLPFDAWLFIQLRGRPVEFVIDSSIDHITALNYAESVEELVKLCSWRNTRLLDRQMNSIKSDFIDEESKLIGEVLLERPVVGRERENPYAQQQAAKDGDRFAKLMERSPGKSYRMRINGKKDQKKGKRR